MKYKLTVLILILGMLAPGLIGTGASAAEIITEEDLIQNIIKEEHLIRLADNVIVLFDSSSSMNETYKDTGMPRYDVARKILKERNAMLPDLGYKAGLYLFTPVETVYPMQSWDKDQFAQAMDKLPAKAEGPTMLQMGLDSIGPVLDGLSGKTKVFIFTDGTYTDVEGYDRKPVEIARELDAKHDVSFYLISYPRDKRAEKTLNDIASVDIVSSVIPFEQFIERPESINNILFTVKATERIETITETRVVGIKIDNIKFDFDVASHRSEFESELDELGKFMQNKPKSYVVMDGYTDSVGTEEYNLGLSKRRVESVANHLMSNYNIDSSRIVINWYGKTNPVAGNDTAEGRSMNRRVEIAVALPK
jgi:OOP family OmpA-OmpF porin